MKEQRQEVRSYPITEFGNRFLHLKGLAFRFDSFLHSLRQPSDKSLRLQAGQIVVEYVLMLIIAVTIALLVINLAVSREPGNEGFLIKAWGGIIGTISLDKTDEVEPQTPPGP